MGFLRDIFDPLFDLLGATLETLHALGAPWWLSIVLLTVGVRTLLFPLTVGQVKSMRRTQVLRPELEEIRERHKGDAKKRNEETAKLYAERGINPVGGCLPVLVQLPIFLVLYYTIQEFETLRSFTIGGLLWFQDLTAPDPYFILPLLYVATMIASQEVALRRTDPRQKGLMRAMPLVFGLFMALGGFPAGLFVYSVTSNTISFFQNLILYRSEPPHTSAEEPGPEPGMSRPYPAPSKDVAANLPARRRRRGKKSRKR